MLDKVREFWNKRPCNFRHSDKQLGSLAYFGEVSQRRYFVEHHIREFAEFDKWRDKIVMEVGCGIGTDTHEYLRHGAHVRAYELSEHSLEMAKIRARTYNYNIGTVSQGGNVEFYHVPDGRTFTQRPEEAGPGLIYSFGVIHHDPNPWGLLNSIRNAVANGTKFKIMLYHKWTWKTLWIILKFGHGRFWKAKELISKHSEAQTGCPVTYVYSKKQAKNLIESAGFRVNSMKIDFIFPYKISDYKQYKYTTVWYFWLLPNWLFRWIEHHFGWHILIEGEAV